MATSLKLAWRNVQRNRRRTIITASAIVVGCTMMIVVNGIITGLLDRTISNSVELETGHIKVYPQGYYEKSDLLPTNLHITDYTYVINLINTIKGVVDESPRIKAGGILQTGDDSTRVIINGITAHDLEIRNLEKRIQKGEFFTQNYDSVMVGRLLAERLTIQIGSEVFLNSVASDGTPVSAQFIVTSIFETGFSSYDSTMVFIDLSKAQTLLKMGNKDVIEIVVMVDHPERINEVTSLISSTLENNYEVFHWEELSPELAQFAEMERSMSFLFLSIVIIVAVIGILNTMLMAVYERVKEVGVMAAFGYKRLNIVSLFVMEGVFIGVIGALVGCVIGVVVVYYFSGAGMNFAGADVVEFMEPVIYPRLSVTDVVFPFVFAVGIALLAALYPAYKASSMEPAEALRHV